MHFLIVSNPPHLWPEIISADLRGQHGYFHFIPGPRARPEYDACFAFGIGATKAAAQAPLYKNG